MCLGEKKISGSWQWCLIEFVWNMRGKLYGKIWRHFPISIGLLWLQQGLHRKPYFNTTWAIERILKTHQSMQTRIFQETDWMLWLYGFCGAQVQGNIATSCHIVAATLMAKTERLFHNYANYTIVVATSSLFLTLHKNSLNCFLFSVDWYCLYL